MACGIEDVMVEFFASDRVEPFAPTDFLTSTLLRNSLITANQQQDAHEFMQFLLNDLHEAASEGVEKDCECFIHKIFYGKLQSEVTCERCKNVTTSFDPMMDLSLSLRTPERKKRKPKSRKDKDKDKNDPLSAEVNGKDNTPEPNGVNGSTPPIPSPEAIFTLYDCLERFTKVERLGKDDYSCAKCGDAGKTAEATKQFTIKQLPPVLAIQLKRFEHTEKGSLKIESFVKYPPLLDMRPYLSITQKAKPGARNLTNGMAKPKGKKREPHPDEALYELQGVVVHIGKVDAGHYVSYHRVRGSWFKFNDEHVTSVTEETVYKEKAYLLFYVIRNLE